MSDGVKVYNWVEKRFYWVVNGKAYDHPQHVPTSQTKRPYIDPGKPISKKP